MRALAVACVVLGAAGAGALACDIPPGAVPLAAAAPDTPPVFLTLDPPPLSRPFQLDLWVCAPDPVAVATVAAIMPAHRHGMNYTPTVERLGGGQFRVSGLMFHMPGEWRIQITIQTDAGRAVYTHDTATR